MNKGDVATWSKLPDELLEIIARRLTYFIDYVRFGAVCQLWQSTMVNMHHHLTFQDPWLFLSTREDNSMICGFYILSTRNVFELKLPETHVERCVESSKGWLVMVDENLSIHLFNPCTRVQFPLPHQMTFQDQNYLARGYTTKELRDVFILKVLLSSSPSNPNYICMAIYSDFWKLAIARPGDEAWTTIPSEWSHFCDVIYYKEQFYAISWNGKVVYCDVDAHPKTMLLTTPVKISYGQKYLVECSGDLLQVIRHIKFVNDYPDFKTIWFDVFKLDFCSKLWIEMKSLGDQSLFLGYNNSFSFCCNDYSMTGVKRNCVYFTDDYLEAHHQWLPTDSGGSDMGVFHLDDGHIEPHYSGHACHPFSPPIRFNLSK